MVDRFGLADQSPHCICTGSTNGEARLPLRKRLVFEFRGFVLDRQAELAKMLTEGVDANELAGGHS